jgi:hypothetical protein
LSAYGATKSWNDAIFRLSDELGHIQAEHLVVDDWGILHPLIALHRNRLPLVYADQSFLAPGTTEVDRKWSIKTLAEDVWIGHTPQFEQWAGDNERVVRVARQAGLEKQIIETVPDRNGRPVFEIFRFVRSGGVAASN